MCMAPAASLSAAPAHWPYEISAQSISCIPVAKFLIVLSTIKIENRQETCLTWPSLTRNTCTAPLSHFAQFSNFLPVGWPSPPARRRRVSNFQFFDFRKHAGPWLLSRSGCPQLNSKTVFGRILGSCAGAPQFHRATHEFPISGSVRITLSFGPGRQEFPAPLSGCADLAACWEFGKYPG